jgi:site-specific DNA-cytosine methylase
MDADLTAADLFSGAGGVPLALLRPGLIFVSPSR